MVCRNKQIHTPILVTKWQDEHLTDGAPYGYISSTVHPPHLTCPIWWPAQGYQLKIRCDWGHWKCIGQIQIRSLDDISSVPQWDQLRQYQHQIDYGPSSSKISWWKIKRTKTVFYLPLNILILIRSLNYANQYPISHLLYKQAVS